MEEIKKHDYESRKMKPVTISNWRCTRKISRNKLYSMILKEEIKLYGNDCEELITSGFSRLLSYLHDTDQIHIFGDGSIKLTVSSLTEPKYIFIKDVQDDVISFLKSI